MQKSRTLGSRASRPQLAFATLSEASIGSLTPLSSVLGRSGLRPSLVRGDSPRNAPLQNPRRSQYAPQPIPHHRRKAAVSIADLSIKPEWWQG